MENSAAKTVTPKVETNASRAYVHLRDRLISGDYKPGTRLLYGPIGKEIGVSATPVREAAGRLANEGLVELVPQMGAIVRTLDPRELAEIYEVRQVIEPVCAELATQRATKAQIQSIQEQSQVMWSIMKQQQALGTSDPSDEMHTRFYAADYQFHTRIIEATGNSALVRTASQSNALSRVFSIRRHRHTNETMLSTCQEHDQVLSAIQAGESRKARDAMLKHIQQGLKESLELLKVDDSTEES